MWPFKARPRVTQHDIESHLARLNNLTLAYQDDLTAADEAWLESRISLEVAWFARNRLKLSRTKEGQHIVV